MKKILILIVAMCLAVTLVACGQNSNNNKSSDGTYYTVTFDSQGGSAVASQRVLAGNPIVAPTSPAREDFDFVGWYLSTEEDACLWDFALDRVASDITLYARWTARQDTSAPSDTLTFEMGDGGYIVTGDKSQAATIVIPAQYNGEPVVGIGESAFAYSRHKSDIISVTIPDSVTEIGLNAFHNRKTLKEVKIGENSRLKSIGHNAFSGNSALKEIYLPAGFETLGNDVFNNCGSLNTITVAAGNTHYSGAGNCLINIETDTLIRGSNTSVIPNTVKTIGEAAFRKATLTKLTIPSSVTTIEKYAFSDSSIETINYEGTTADWDKAIKDENGKERMWKSGAQNIVVKCSDTPKTNNILVAYFSATGTTRGVAEKIADATGGKLYEIAPSQPYTQEDLAYGNSSCRANNEQNSATARPAISGSVQDMAKYEVVYLGYPIWWSKAPKIIYTFLESYEFAGKTIVPFCTSGGSPIDGSLPEIQALATDATWLSGRRFDSSATSAQIKTWTDGLFK